MPNKALSNAGPVHRRVDGTGAVTRRRSMSFLAKINSISSGLTVVETPEPCLGAVRETFETQFACGGEIAGVCSPPAEFVWSMHSGGVRVLDELNALAALEGNAKHTAPREFYQVGTRRNYNFCSDEGLETLVPIIDSANCGCVTFSQSCGALSLEQLVAAIYEIRSAAEKSSAYAVMFIGHSEREQMPDIRDFCDEYFNVEECEPDPNAHQAFSIASARLRNMYVFGYGKVMCNLRMTDMGYERTFEPFIAKSLLDRLIWKLRASGKSLAEVGSLVDLHKSNVKRRLDEMRPPCKQTIPMSQLEQYIDSLVFDDVDTSNSDLPVDDFD
ncbi:hypothetical protein PCA31118_05106 [Pandoraea captiosa]|uniref:Uncharacterized protein n=1 Tax=Pandoraea captiosa TaxID=2508302 RepID=A0A5E5AQ73_9BURK|nr:hypothetical protein [Pandoraea captiosa]VVE75961.1 hypothetical protein PCA31118_05106 [Pandoraea captiosa]